MGWRNVGDKQRRSLTSKPTYVSIKIFNKTLVAVHNNKETLMLNRPAYVEICILDLSKTLMYEFHNKYIKRSMVEKQSYCSRTRTV